MGAAPVATSRTRNAAAATATCAAPSAMVHQSSRPAAVWITASGRTRRTNCWTATGSRTSSRSPATSVAAVK
jgi:hypothetical protein